jgi:hypothetical protein
MDALVVASATQCGNGVRTSEVGQAGPLSETFRLVRVLGM